ncbi:sensor histidine kinase [Thermophagus sp. OGC60D27]|uniref:sensor histidine kinase n=1 Tax=Thermophagus sp. OGC60D27 TaxID=3458415 RepID=UPI0040377C3F
MNLFKPITKFFPFNRKTNCLKDPSDFFASCYAKELVKSVNPAISESETISSLEALALKISKISRAEYTLITRLTPKQKLQVAAFTHMDQLFPNAHIAPFQTPLFPALLDSTIVNSSHANKILTSLGITKHHAKTVTAMLLKDHENIPLGVIFIFTRSHQSKLLVTNTLHFFSFYIASELRHIAIKEILEKKNEQLLKTEEELKNKNTLLDNLNKRLSRAKQIVEESNRLKSAFLANLSHEIRTPMNVIMGFTELLSAEDMSSNQRRNYIDIIQQNASRLLNIMDSLIDISRFQAKKIGNEQQPFSLNKILRLLYSHYLSEINISGKPLNLKMTPGTIDGQDTVFFNKEAIYKVLNHLIDNAIKFTASGFVHFGYEVVDKQIIFFVEDSGIGIPEGKEKEIFDLFRQGDLRLSRQFGGTGIGLAIAKGFVGAMGGKIWCSNRGKGNGVTGAIFKFALPYNPSTKDLYTRDKTMDPNEGSKRQLSFPAATTKLKNL